MYHPYPTCNLPLRLRLADELEVDEDEVEDAHPFQLLPRLGVHGQELEGSVSVH